MLRKMRISRPRTKTRKRPTHDLFCDCRKCVKSVTKYINDLSKA